MQESTPERREQQRVFLVRLTTFIYLLLIFEGALRKWALPSLSGPLTLVRDPFVLFLYFRAAGSGWWPRSWGMNCMLLLIGVLSMIGVYYVGIGRTDVVTLMWGLRTYMVPIPFPFIIGSVFKREDLERFVRITLLLAIPIAGLTYVQFKSPASSWINQVSANGKGVFTVADGVVRTTGTFSFTGGQSCFVGCLVALACGAWFQKGHHRLMRFRWLLACTAGVLSNLAVSGSRGAFLMSAAMFLASILATFIGGKLDITLKQLVIGMAILSLTGWFMVYVVPDTYRTIALRFAVAAKSESLEDRVMSSFGSDAFSILERPDLPSLGTGIGSTAVNLFGPRRIPGTFMSTASFEGEAGRLLAEGGPVFGPLLIIIRIFIAIYLCVRTFGYVRRKGDMLPFMCSIFLLPVITIGQVIGNNTIAGFTWIFAGICLANWDMPDTEAGEVLAARVS